jgi:hypothetical protein
MKAAGVKGTTGRRIGGSGAFFDNAAQIHHGNPVCDLSHHREIVRNEEIGEPAMLLEIGEQVEYLSLHRYIERGDRLVAYDERRLHRESPRDTDPLPLASGEFMGIAASVAGIEPYLLQQGGDTIRNLRSRSQPMDLDPFGNGGPNRHTGIE